MRVLLSTLNSKYIHTALSLRYLKAYAEGKLAESELSIREFTINQSINHILGEIYRERPDVLAMSVYIWNINETLDIVKSLKKVAPEVKVILGGPEVSFEIEKLLEETPEIDYVIYGEGEASFLDLIRTLHSGGEIEKVDGVAFRKDGKAVVNKPRKLLETLDEIPPVYGDDLSEYRDKIIYYESSRGCPFNCKFCLSSTIDGLRFAGLERVKRDMKIFLDANVKQVKFIDRTFNARKDYSREIMEYLYSNDNGTTNFHFEVTAHLIDEDTLQFLSNMPEGLFQFEIGVQSTNEKTIEDVTRTTDFEKLSQAVKRLKALGNIHLHLDLIAGLPYEGYESFRKSFNDVYSLDPDKLQLGFLKLLKGSAMRAEADKHEFKFMDKAPYEVLETKYLSYGDMLRLKDIEEVVEIYGNESDFEKTVKYLIGKYDTPFDFYEDFSDYCRRSGFYDSPKSKLNQYKKLVDFYNYKGLGMADLFRDLLKFDFIRNTKSPNVPDFIKAKSLDYLKDAKMKFIRDEANREKYFSNIPEQDKNKIVRLVHFEEFEYNVLDAAGDYQRENKVIMFIYDKSERALEKSRAIDVTDEMERYMHG